MDKIRNFLNKDVKEFGLLTLLIPSILFLILVGLISYKSTNSSFAVFTDSIEGSKVIKLHYEGKESSNLDQSGANKPVLSDNMIAVYHDEKADVWKKADSTNKDKDHKWYDYNNKMWANSVTVTSSSRDTYLNAEVGKEISMDDVLTMQVWIPRYKYKVWNYNENGVLTSNSEPIEIMFEEGISTTGEITCSDSISGTNGVVSQTCKINKEVCTDEICNNVTYTHPAFTMGDTELKGIWVGKFETGSSCTESSGCDVNTVDAIVKPDVQSWRGARVGTFDDVIRSMSSNTNKYGFTSTDDVHMIKNTEWGAVAYLSQSVYGLCGNRKCSEVNINNSEDYYTGRSGGFAGGSTKISKVYKSEDSDAQYNKYGFYTYDGYLLDYNTNKKSSTKDLSKVASTTGNIYGVYDMSGGSDEYTMANMISVDGNNMLSGTTTDLNSGYKGKLYNSGDFISYTGKYKYPTDKYLDKYSYGETNTQRLRSKLGDGVKEVYSKENSSWYGDSNYVISADAPWSLRGGLYSSSTGAGIFSLSGADGSANVSRASRLVIINE